jgi:hypothetical protein
MTAGPAGVAEANDLVLQRTVAGVSRHVDVDVRGRREVRVERYAERPALALRVNAREPIEEAIAFAPRLEDPNLAGCLLDVPDPSRWIEGESHGEVEPTDDLVGADRERGAAARRGSGGGLGARDEAGRGDDRRDDRPDCARWRHPEDPLASPPRLAPRILSSAVTGRPLDGPKAGGLSRKADDPRAHALGRMGELRSEG